jgi:ribulose-phosphate 3-epimerase
VFNKVPKISFSLLAALNQSENLQNVLKTIDGSLIDMIHYDVSDHETTLHLSDIQKLKQCTQLPFDVHLAVKNPLEYLPQVQLEHKDYFCIHVENNLNLSELEKVKQTVNCQFGLGISKETPVTELYDKILLLDYVLFMAAIPGVSGGQFDDSVIDKIKTFRRLFPTVKVHVDGGINRVSAALLRDIGVDVLISGSYIFNANDSMGQVLRLFGRNLHLNVSDIMRTGSGFPKIAPNDSIQAIASEIDQKKIGATCVLDKEGRLMGIITDGDLRRCIIAQRDLTSIKAKDVLNPDPFIISPKISILQMLRTIEKTGRTFVVVPVVGDDQYCQGVIWIQDILFSDLL